MKLKQLLKIKQEIDVFALDLSEAIKKAKSIKGWSGYNGEIYGKNDISNLKESGQLKRGYLTLKYRLNKLFNGYYDR
jgi:hypothetical protein